MVQVQLFPIKLNMLSRSKIYYFYCSSFDSSDQFFSFKSLNKNVKFFKKNFTFTYNKEFFLFQFTFESIFNLNFVFRTFKVFDYFNLIDLILYQLMIQNFSTFFQKKTVVKPSLVLSKLLQKKIPFLNINTSFFLNFEIFSFFSPNLEFLVN